jgi:hypothetical protein
VAFPPESDDFSVLDVALSELPDELSVELADVSFSLFEPDFLAALLSDLLSFT